jgi:hypothetical protein
MGKIKARHVHSRADHFFQNRRGIRGRPDGADNFSFVGREGHGVPHILDFGFWIQ